MTAVVSAVANFIQLFTILAQSNICEGNSDQRYLELPSIKNDCIKDVASKCYCSFLKFLSVYMHAEGKTVALLEK